MYERLTKGQETCGNSVGNYNNNINNHSINSDYNNNNNNVNSINADSDDSSGGSRLNTGADDTYIPLNVQRTVNFPMNAKTFTPPPPLPPIGNDCVKKGELLILNVLNREVTHKKVNPDLTSVIAILFTDHQILYVKALVNHLQNSAQLNGMQKNCLTRLTDITF
ncbi:phosphatidylinositol 3,4,5-trisphosphate 3-phosphatase cnrN-like [Macrobrachium nipponense]|uniref:phosphatidylinositol 3,4,5-trisphosphate 3-phosphatase cnrN-like n=1 Tax=Macrobrachium nipponense TaxID=159736 RepID=UPI0030C833DE